MIACVSPAECNASESLSTLRYANRARNIKNKLSINQESDGNHTFEIIQLKKQISSLKHELLLARGWNSSKSSNEDLLRQINGLIEEKSSLEAENNSYKAVLHSCNLMQPNDKIFIEKSASITRTDLQKLQELYPLLKDQALLINRLKHQQSLSLNSMPNSNDAISRAKSQIFQKLQNLERLKTDSLDSPGIEDSNLENDAQLKQELVDLIERQQREYRVMQEKYEAQLRLMQNTMNSLQKERDISLRSIPIKQDLSKITRGRYEEKIKKLGREVEEMKLKLIESERTAKSKQIANENAIKTLKTQISGLKAEKSKSVSKLTDEFNQMKASVIDYEGEIKELKQRERRAVELANKLKKGYAMQRSILLKKNDQFRYTQSKFRALVNMIRKRKIGQLGSPAYSKSIGNLLESPSIWKIVSTPSGDKEEKEAFKIFDDCVDVANEAPSTPTKRFAVSAGVNASPFGSHEDLQQTRSVSEGNFSFATENSAINSPFLNHSTSKDIFDRLSESASFTLPLSKRTESQSNILHRFSLVSASPASKQRLISEISSSGSLLGHVGPVLSICSLGNTLFSASQDGSVRTWDILTGSFLHFLQGAGGFARCLSVCKEGILASSSNDTIKLWDINGSKMIKQLANAKLLDIQALQCFGNILVAAAGEALSVWDIRKYEKVAYCNSHKGSVFSIAQTESSIYSGGRDHLIKIWDASTFELLHTFTPPHYGAVSSLAVYNGMLISGSRDGCLRKWSIFEEKKGLQSCIPNAHKDWVRCIEPIENSSLIASASKDGSIKVWDLRGERHDILAEKANGHDDSVNCLNWNGQFLFSGGHDRAINIWKISK